MSSLSLRKSLLEDGEHFKHWLLQPNVLQYFPMDNLREIEDSVRVWMIFCQRGASITALWENAPCGIAFLNLQAYRKFAHQCLITIIVDEPYRNRGVGTGLLEALFPLAKEEFHMEFLHLEVYENNPAIRLYKRLGFEEFGKQEHFIKEKGHYIGKTMMQRPL